jgi:hypothetical protein
MNVVQLMIVGQGRRVVLIAWGSHEVELKVCALAGPHEGVVCRALRKMDRARNKQLLQLQPANPVSLQSAQIGSTSARHAGRGKPDGAASPTI